MRSEEDLDAEPKGADEYYECQRRDGTLQTWIGIVHVRVTACTLKPFLLCLAEFGDRRAANIPVLGRDIFKNISSATTAVHLHNGTASDRAEKLR